MNSSYSLNRFHSFDKRLKLRDGSKGRWPLSKIFLQLQHSQYLASTSPISTFEAYFIAWMIYFERIWNILDKLLPSMTSLKLIQWENYVCKLISGHFTLSKGTQKAWSVGSSYWGRIWINRHWAIELEGSQHKLHFLWTQQCRAASVAACRMKHGAENRQYSFVNLS